MTNWQFHPSLSFFHSKVYDAEYGIYDNWMQILCFQFHWKSHK